ncbi:MAG: alpha/beta hydrolase [Actinomycetota bacterium]
MRRPLVIALAVVGLLSTGCLPTIRPGGPAPLRYRDLVFGTVSVTSNIEYGTAVNQLNETVSLKMDVYQPNGDTVASRPAIVWIHGGGFSSGTKTSPEIVDEANEFARRGFVSVSISYRLWPGGCFPVSAQCVIAIGQAAEDARNAVKYLRDNVTTYGIDTTRIAAAGTSAGAITALNVGYDSSDPAKAVRATVSLSGAKIGPSAGPGDAPSLLFHGTNDSLVPYQWAVNTVNEAKAAGLRSFLTTWEGAGHVPYVQNRQQILDQTTNFLYWDMNLALAAR